MREKLAVWQPKLLAQFDQLLSTGRLSHAYLFSGAFGSVELALYLAQSRFCDNLSDQALPCQECRSCRLIASGEFADVTILEPSGQLIKTDQVRELVKEFGRSGYERNCQVFIIKEADKMHPNAANSLLKQIEEPTSEAYVFLLTRDESKVLPTIRSRCQIYRLVADRAYLMRQFEEAGLLKSQANILAQLTDDPGQISALAANKRLLEVIGLGQRFLDQLRRDGDLAYLELGRLVTLAQDKADQELVFDVLAVQLGQDLSRPASSAMFQKLQEVRRMWLANVSFQNCLDYLVLTLEEGR